MENVMVIPPNSFADLQRAAAAYRHALRIREEALSLAAEFPKMSAKLEEVAKLLVAEGKKAEAAE
jgi:hypothetical protein